MKNLITFVTVTILLYAVPSRSDIAALRRIMRADPLTVHEREGPPVPQNVNLIKPASTLPARQEAASTQMRRETFSADPIEKPKLKPASGQSGSWRLSPGQSFSMGRPTRNFPSSRGRTQPSRRIRPTQARSTPNRQAPVRRTRVSQRAEPARPFVGGMQAQPGTGFLKPCPPHRFSLPPKTISQRVFEQKFLMQGILTLASTKDCYPSDLIVYLTLLLDERRRRFNI